MHVQARFHLAFPVTDLAATRAFYQDLLGCSVGRSAERWIDFDFFGHQISAHLVDAEALPAAENMVDGDRVPARHFGAILTWSDFEALRDRLLAAGIQFRIAPRVRFEGDVGEQATMFFDDPSGNALEMKAFRDDAQVFARADG
jgi:extradiol dioxygenase family protein